ncbi:hypothetical protein J1614_009221 [Plenodomus biglobosus]|nr:hypothetical protein J1614_009221 [Plenodomus biglobosus]
MAAALARCAQRQTLAAASLPGADCCAPPPPSRSGELEITSLGPASHPKSASRPVSIVSLNRNTLPVDQSYMPSGGIFLFS